MELDSLGHTPTLNHTLVGSGIQLYNAVHNAHYETLRKIVLPASFTYVTKVNMLLWEIYIITDYILLYNFSKIASVNGIHTKQLSCNKDSFSLVMFRVGVFTTSFVLL